jgi:signal transduction histidine kinase
MSPVVVSSGADHVRRYAKQRLGLLLSALAIYSVCGILLPLGLYTWVLRSPWWLALAVACTVQCAVLEVGRRMTRRGKHGQALMLVCASNWMTFLFVTFVFPDLLPVCVLGALVMVVFAEPYIRWQRKTTFAVITAGTAGCVLALAAFARFQNVSHLSGKVPRWIETAFFIPALVFIALYLLVIVWNNATALQTSRARLITAADEQRRRLERDLHDGAQQHLVALSVLIQLARSAEPDRYQPLLAEATELAGTAIAEIRRLAQGIYPPLLVSGGLPQALPSVAAQAAIPTQLRIEGLARYPAPVETALYFCCSEALQNAAKHGGPGTTVTITAHADARMLTLTISDTGRGFDRAGIGIGLTNMTDRLSAIGGKLSIETAPGRGTRVTAVVATSAQPDSKELPADSA